MEIERRLEDVPENVNLTRNLFEWQLKEAHDPMSHIRKAVGAQAGV